MWYFAMFYELVEPHGRNFETLSADEIGSYHERYYKGNEDKFIGFAGPFAIEDAADDAGMKWLAAWK